MRVLDEAGVYGAFVSLFVSQITPYDKDPRYDLDMASMSLVKSYSGSGHGITYPDMPWEPKESFRVVADYYLKNYIATTMQINSIPSDNIGNASSPKIRK
ncbi:MAG: hypothetical protein ACHQ1H_00020 [Nitrososphaerales archaeon]